MCPEGGLGPEPLGEQKEGGAAFGVSVDGWNQPA